MKNVEKAFIGGTISGGLNTIKNEGVLTINDGTFINDSQAVLQNYNKAVIHGGLFKMEKAGGDVISNLAINVRAWKSYKGNTVYGKYSKAKRVKVK